MIIRIVAADIPRETVKGLLSATRKGRGVASRLTAEIDGHYFAVIDDEGAATDFKAQLDLMTVRHNQVASLPHKPQPAPTPLFARAAAFGPRSADAADRLMADLLDSLSPKRRSAGI